ncbi:Fc.00g021320.m01.CDS01 [Cosmosporella sp. VM-42]
MAVRNHGRLLWHPHEPSSNFMDSLPAHHVSRCTSRNDLTMPRITVDVSDALNEATNRLDSTSCQKNRRKRSRHGEAVDGVVVQRPISRARHMPRDSEYTTEASGVRLNRMVFSPDSLASLHTYGSSIVEVERPSSHWAYPKLAPTPPPIDIRPGASDLDGLGSWFKSDTIDDKKLPDELLYRAMPMTPQPPKLPSPNLAPLCMDYEFCPCCEDDCTCCGSEDDRINKIWYLSGRGKMDSQLKDATAYIARHQSRGRTSREILSRYGR